MDRRVIIFFGILGVVLSLVMGLFSVVAWEIVAVLIAVSLGIPGLILGLEKMKPEESSELRKGEREHERERINLPAPSIEERKIQNGKAETAPSLEVEKRKSMLLPDNAQITKLNIDDSLLNQIYEQAYRKAIDIYHDAQLSRFTIQVLPFSKYGAQIGIYMDFYSKWADKLCKFQYSDFSQKLKHYPPDKHPIADSDRNILTNLPWKMSPQWMQILSRVYDKIKPLPSVDGTGYYISAYTNRQTNWQITFEDGLSGNEYRFEWDGSGLDENSIKQLS